MSKLKINRVHYANQYMLPLCGINSRIVTNSLTRSNCMSCERHLAKQWGVSIETYRRFKSEARQEAERSVKEFKQRQAQRKEAQAKPRPGKLGHRKNS